jgi:hypothetical protein
MKDITSSNPKNNLHNKVAIIVTLIALIFISLLGIYTWNQKNNIKVVSTQPQALNLQQQDTQEVVASTANVNVPTQEQQLLYLIEEEKLAHDVYTVMSQTYGSKIFSNISSSEQTHQDKVLNLLNSLGIEDPRSDEIGVFVNSDLQNLYNQLISKGMQSVDEAYKVGVAIETMDIADLAKQIESTTDSSIISVLTVLKNGSENHLNAFSKKV